MEKKVNKISMYASKSSFSCVSPHTARGHSLSGPFLEKEKTRGSWEQHPPPPLLLPTVTA